MTDNNTGDDKKLSVSTGAKPTLSLKRPGIEQSTVRQNFSHGRTKAVVVETKKSKFGRPDEKAKQVFTPVQPAAAAPVRPQVSAPAPVQPRVESRPAPQQPSRNNSGMVLNVLSNDEMAARRRALEGSVVRDAEERTRAVEETRRRAEEDARRRREAEASALRQAEEVERRVTQR